MRNRCQYVAVLMLLFVSTSIGAQELIGSAIMVEDENFAIGQDVSVSADGKRMAVSGYGESLYGVKVYDLVDGEWVAQAAIAETEFPSEMVVYSSVISADGSTLAVGAVINSFENNRGRVRLYRSFNGTWSQVGETIMPNTENEYFGQKLALSADGDRVAVAAKYNSEIEKNQGRVAVFEFNGTNWKQLGQSIYGERKGFKFGSSVSMSADGNFILVGSIGAYIPTGYGNVILSAGNVELLKFQNNQWNSIMRRKGENSDNMGIATAIAADGITFVFGATQNYFQPGYLKILKYNDLDILDLFQQIGGDEPGYRFGRNIAFSEDGSRMVVASVPINGLYEESSFIIYGLLDNSYRVLGKLHVGETSDNVGAAMSFSADGNTLAIGALSYDFYNRGTEQGYVLTYDLSEVQFTEPPEMPNPGDGPTLSEESLYPNPATDLLFCEACDAVVSIAIHDVSGKKILGIDAYDSEAINLSALQSGLYYVYLSSATDDITVKKFIKK